MNIPDSLSGLKRQLESNPKDSVVLQNYAHLLRKLGKNAEAYDQLFCHGASPESLLMSEIAKDIWESQREGIRSLQYPDERYSVSYVESLDSEFFDAPIDYSRDYFHWAWMDYPECLDSERPILALDLREASIGQRDWEILPTLKTLRSLFLSGTDTLSDSILESLVTLPSLTVLDLGFCAKLSAKGLYPLSKLSQLRSLTLDESELDLHGLTQLISLKHLEILSINMCSQLENDCLPIVAQLANLKELHIDMPNIDSKKAQLALPRVQIFDGH